MDHLAPTFLVAGAGRCGTTGLIEGLRTHPDVFVTQPKEPHFFALHDTVVDYRAPGDEATINRVSVTNQTAYLALFDGADQRCRGEGSVSTMYFPGRSIPKILEINPDMRIVLILREPVDRAFSAYQYMSARGFETEATFAGAVAAEASRRAANWHHLWHYTQMSLYSKALAAFLGSFPASQVGVFFYDDLQSDYTGTVASVLRFIGAPRIEGEALGVPRVNMSGTPRSAAVHRALQLATANELVRGTVKRVTSYRMREFVRRSALRRDGVDAVARAQLAPRFTADLQELRALLAPRLGSDLPPWLASPR